MPNQMLSQWTSRLRSNETPTRRTGHGGNAWSLPVGTKELRQPQDGATEVRSRVASITARLSGPLMFEPEDATITGGTRSLTRRLMGLNVMKPERKAPGIATIAGPRTRVA